MAVKSTGVVLDTNLWVSMAMGSRVVSEQMLTVIENSAVNLYVSVELLEELIETLAKPKLQKYLTQERTQYVFDLIWLKTKLVKVNSLLRICRDQKDDFVINLAIDSKADYIITGDDDLLILQTVHAIKLLTIAEFVQEL